MPNIGPWEILLILVAMVFLFGAKKLPELGKSIGSGIKEFKKSLTIADEEETQSSEKNDAKPSEEAQSNPQKKG